MIANDCDFASFDSALFDQCIMGLSDSKIQSKLLAEKTLTLASTVEKVLNFEKSFEEAQIMHGETCEQRRTESVTQTLIRIIRITLRTLHIKTVSKTVLMRIKLVRSLSIISNVRLGASFKWFKFCV